MRTKDALVNALQAKIDTETAVADSTSPLKDVYLFGTPRGSVEAAEKVIRVRMDDLILTQSTDENCKEQNVWFELECFVLPSEAGDLEAEDEAILQSFDIAEAAYDYLNSDPDLSGTIDTLLFPEDETNTRCGMANFAGAKYGGTVVKGVVNP